MRRSIASLVLLLPALALMGAGAAEEPPDAAAGGSASAMPETRFNEAPMLAALVAAGELPPVDERLPLEPAVTWFAPGDVVGTYGGTLTVFHTNEYPWNDLGDETETGGYFGRMVKGSLDVVPSMAKALEFSDDAMALTVHLREGLRWSDGHPMTTDDVVFMYDAMHFNELVPTWNWIPQIKRAIKIDDYTVRLETDIPYVLMYYKMSTVEGGGWNVFHPKHYLEQWHIDYNPDAEALAKEEGFESWDKAFHHHYWWSPLKDLDKPTHHPWIMTEATATGKRYERNPYYWEVDTEGNQLPYVDAIQAQIVDQETYHLKIIAGEADVALLQTSFDNFTLYQENAAAGEYHVNQIPSGLGGAVIVAPNQNHLDPFKREMYRNKRFRQALSLAINREEINDTVYFGVGVPRQATIVSDSPYFQDKWAQSYAAYDPQRASAMLDELGLTARDRDGYRVEPDGDTFLQVIEYWRAGNLPVLELVKEYWEDVGLKTEIKFYESAAIGVRADAAQHDFYTDRLASPELRSWMVAGSNWRGGDFAWARQWHLWMVANRDVESGAKTLDDFADGKLPGEEPPEEIKQLNRWIDDWAAGRPGDPDYVEAFTKVFDYHAENVYLIGTVGITPHLYVVKDKLANAPLEYGPSMSWKGDLLVYASKMFIKG